MKSHWVRRHGPRIAEQVTVARLGRVARLAVRVLGRRR